MTIDNQAVMEVFLTETQENLDNAEDALVALEETPDAPEPLEAVFRNIHTLKGNVQSIGLREVGELAHVVEDLLERVRLRRLSLTPELATVLLRSVDALRTMVAQRVRPGASTTAAHGQFAARVSTSLRVELGKLDHLLNLVGEVVVAREQLGALLEGVTGGQGEASRDAHHDADRLYVELQEA